MGAQIAEAWAKRRYEKYFVSKLTDADGEQQETQHWLETTLDCNYLTAETVKGLTDRYHDVGRMINSHDRKSKIILFLNIDSPLITDHPYWSL